MFQDKIYTVHTKYLKEGARHEAVFADTFKFRYLPKFPPIIGEISTPVMYSESQNTKDKLKRKIRSEIPD